MPQQPNRKLLLIVPIFALVGIALFNGAIFTANREVGTPSEEAIQKDTSELSLHYLNQAWPPNNDPEGLEQASPCAEIEPGNFSLLEKSDQSAWPPKHSRGGEMAICKFMNSPYTKHFPHGMEKVYSCWSFWEANSGHPVIVGPPGYKGFVPSSEPEYVEEMLSAMKGAFNVTVITSDKLNPSDLAHAVDPNYPNKTYHILRDDAWKWTGGILRHEKVERVGCKGPLRIGILNRNGTRSITNAHYIRDQVMRRFGDKVQMDITTFDGKSFREQIAWYASHNIIFSSHGAQDTSIPFMPKCGVFIEIYPIGLYIPYMFGSLSDSCHVKHYAVYTNQSPDPFGETKNMSSTPRERYVLRAQNFCPTAGTMVSYLTTAMQDVLSCCDNNN